MSLVSGTVTDLLFANIADGTALASSASEGSLLTGLNQQPTLPANFFSYHERARALQLRCSGLFSNTGTPTLTFTVRLGSTQGASDLTGTAMGVSAAITTGSGVTNARWELTLDLVCRTVGQGSGNTTLAGSGRVDSTEGFASPYSYSIEPTTPPTATWTATANAALQLYFNVSATWSASSASNTITLKHITLVAWN